MPYTIIRDNIVNLRTDAIVNAANNRLLAGGGVCGAIFQAAGAEDLQRACDQIGYCETGDAVITGGFQLPAKYIIHTVGPVYGKDPEKEEKELYSCYRRSLELAEKHQLRSIAFPVISSGIYGYPPKDAIRVASRAIRDYLDDREMDIYLVVYDRETFAISETLFDSVQSFIDERMIQPDVRRTEGAARIDVDHCESAPLLPNVPDPVCDEEVSDASGEALFLSHDDTARPVAAASAAKRKAGAAFVEAVSLDEILRKKTETFSQMLLRIIDEKGMSDTEVYKRANIDRKLFSKIRKTEYVPRKTTVLALAVALRLSKDEAAQLLGRAGFAFSEASKLDVIVEYFIEHEIYDIFELNETLFEFGQPLLGFH